MTASRNSALHFAAAALLAALAASLPASAQDASPASQPVSPAAAAPVGPPTPIFPSGGADTVGAPQSPISAAGPAAPPPAVQPAPAEQGPDSEYHAQIQATPLAPTTALTVAAASTGGALPASLWSGASRALLDALLPKLPASTAPSLQSLAIRLLASDAAPPPEPQGTPGGDMVWTAMRAERLEALGHTDLALALLRAVPGSEINGDMAQVLADLAFLNGDDQGACGLVGRRRPEWQNSFWDEAQITCQALAGQSGPASIGLDALREEQVKDDAFIALVQRVLGIPAKTPDGWTASPALALPLFAKSGQPFPRKALDDAPPALLRALTLRSNLSPDIRLAAAEKAAAYGAIAPDKLADAYLSVPLGDADQAKAARGGNGAGGRAILFASARDTRDPAVKANLLNDFLDKAARAGFYWPAVQITGEMIAALAPGPALKADAPIFARALYLLGKPTQAQGWAALMAPEDQARLIPLIHLTGGDADWGKTPLAALFGDGRQEGAAIVKASVTAQLLAGIGTPIPGDVVAPLLTEAKGGAWSIPVAGPALLIGNAAAAKQVGSTILGVLITLGGDGVSAPPPVIAEAVTALREIGLTDDARRLAVDAALARGI